MTIEQAVAVSEVLQDSSLGISHTIQVGVHDGMSPRVSCRVDLHLRPMVEGVTLDDLLDIRVAVERSVPGVQMYLSTFQNVGAYFA